MSLPVIAEASQAVSSSWIVAGTVKHKVSQGKTLYNTKNMILYSQNIGLKFNWKQLLFFGPGIYPYSKNSKTDK